VSRKILVIDYESCTGCHLCELACSIKHEGIFNPYLSRISVLTKPEIQTSTPVYCLQCNDAPCARACPVNAITFNDKTGAWEIDYGRCIGCRECAYACPFGAIRLNVTAEPIKCDLCGGDPECVKVCPHNALIFGSEDEVIRELQKRKSVGVVYSLYEKGSQSLPGNRVREAEEAVKTLYGIWAKRKDLNI
jgi:carbon-monoxide dehydrogenase iron sulfur subunit